VEWAPEAGWGRARAARGLAAALEKVAARSGESEPTGKTPAGVARSGRDAVSNCNAATTEGSAGDYPSDFIPIIHPFDHSNLSSLDGKRFDDSGACS
jgi:hypothetical protein